MSESELAAVLTNLNGYGILTETDLNLVLANYFPNGPFLQMTNVAGLGGTNVTKSNPRVQPADTSQPAVQIVGGD